MAETLAICCILCMSAGLVLRLIARRHRSEFGRHIRWCHIRYWFMPGLNGALLTDRGRRLHAWSQVLLIIGIALYCIVFGIGPLV